MELVFRENAALPFLAWAAEIGGGRVLVHHGPRLDRGSNWCADGCWPGAFEEGPPERASDAHFAFTLRVLGDEVRIDCPTHPLERLHILRTDERLFISPSIPFIFALANASADLSYPDYQFDILNLISRISANCGAIPLADGKSLEVIANRRAIVGPDSSVRVEYRPLERTFESFEHYVHYVSNTLKQLRDNATSRSRRAGGFGLISSISRGYDAPAVNVLAVPLGWKEAVTFSTPEDNDDSGAEIGALLGLKVHGMDRHAYKRSSSMPEVEILATGTRGADIVFAGAEPFFRGQLVLTGTAGDRVWDKAHGPLTAADILRSDGSGSGLTEFRWRVGFLHAPVPLIGALGIMSLKSISNARAMAPWSVGGNYDRPIARRLIEQAGVPRNAFGASQRGMISVLFGGSNDSLRQNMSLPAWESFHEFHRRHKGVRSMSHRFARLSKYALHRAERFVGRRLQRIGLIDHAPQIFEPKHQVYPGMASFLFAWATGVMKDRYSIALTGSASNR